MFGIDDYHYRLKADLQDKADDCLIDPMGECTQSLLNLIIFGSATPYLHNGTLVLGDVEEGKGVSFIYIFYLKIWFYLKKIMLNYDIKLNILI